MAWSFTAGDAMDIVRTREADIETLKTWFPDRESSYFWCGPGLRFPFTHQSFIEDIHWERIPAYSLLDSHGELSGFGQFYAKSGRCHLARLVISPKHRSKHLGREFISRLMSIGMHALRTTECSLFVVNFNDRALRCYRALGFVKSPCPPGHEYYDDVDFMVYRSVA
jgi:ribosomal protein S18 acetylase RimI-like enzyme